MAYNPKKWIEFLPEQIERNSTYERSGILNIDKPEGLSSMDVIRVIRKVGSIKKAGHGGTLDPFATGVLPVLINRATKFSDKFLETDKVYSGVMLLGQAYDTQDITGTPVGEYVDCDDTITLDFLNEEAKIFTGKIVQVPPVYSAIKKAGKPLYAYAREGKAVVADQREVFIDSFQFLEKLDAKRFAFEVACQKGVYIRTLIHDLGIKLAVPAVLESLRRTRNGALSADRSVKLQNIQSKDDIEQYILEIDNFVE